MSIDGVEALVFDVFGTVVDWRSSVIAAGESFSYSHGIELDWPRLADRWRIEGYLKPIGRIVAGERPWVPVEILFREYLGRMASEFDFERVGPDALDALSAVWERLEPWADAVGGLERLRSRFVVSPLSNGSFAMLTRMARHGHLPWSCIISADLFRAYKSDPRVYLGAAALLGLPPQRLMMVAAHPSDLRAAQSCGLRTAYVPRPLEWGVGSPPPEEYAADVVASDFSVLADALNR